ncbi:hypothetical protein [Tenuibacillus multivorans]|uniref:Uncharacterized protein n=1 Tax=Tenuibacillus multivorans TaxID=237069 RepID=A0A1G9VZH3_9BACI|nr:hypothetical protein [Tenuibacillus multivorans]GEL78247.1 hypothetical protein TMU01_24820 [Tenuibacillus multivorans]SDM77276.1 hypothetical protein SAMN05216498_0539 [Tenuibacillus multivorans]
MRDNKNWKTSSVVMFILLVVLIYYYVFFLNPKNSIDLFESIRYSDDFAEVENLILEGYESNFKQKDYKYMSDVGGNNASRIMQFTVVDYYEKAYIIMTAPGANKLEIVKVEELPDNVKEYLFEFTSLNKGISTNP